MDKECQAIVSEFFDEIRSSFIESFSKAINFPTNCPNAGRFFNTGLSRQRKANKLITTEISIALLALIREELSYLFDKSRITQRSIINVFETSRLVTAFRIGESDNERSNALKIIDERLEDTYVIFSYAELVSHQDKLHIILANLGDLLIKIDPKLGTKSQYLKNMAHFLSQWNIKLELEVICGFDS